MTATDWIALVQAAFLAIAAVYGWRTYRLATREHAEARAEARKAPLFALYDDVVREFKELANEAERDVAGTHRAQEVAGRQRRLAIALTFLAPDVFNLFATQALTTCLPDDVNRDQIEKARGELLTLFARIEDGEFSIRQVAPSSLRAERAAIGDF
jgi:hypothetical protein